jgi:4'-phosphopantetheinyl transferase
LWTIRLDDVHRDLSAVVSSVERERAEKFLRPTDRTRSLLAASLLRRAAGSVLGLDPSDVEVRRDCRCGRPHGRPTLPGTGLHASVSHAGDLVVVALTDAAEVGVDVEQVRDVDVASLGRHVLAPGETAPADRSAFFALWTRKEAVVKATGDGIAALTRVHVHPGGSGPEVVGYDGRVGLRVSLVDLDVEPGYAGALAVLTERGVEIRREDAAPAAITPGEASRPHLT